MAVPLCQFTVEETEAQRGDTVRVRDDVWSLEAKLSATQWAPSLSDRAMTAVPAGLSCLALCFTDHVNPHPHLRFPWGPALRHSLAQPSRQHVLARELRHRNQRELDLNSDVPPAPCVIQGKWSLWASVWASENRSIAASPTEPLFGATGAHDTQLRRRALALSRSRPVLPLPLSDGGPRLGGPEMSPDLHFLDHNSFCGRLLRGFKELISVKLDTMLGPKTAQLTLATVFIFSSQTKHSLGSSWPASGSSILISRAELTLPRLITQLSGGHLPSASHQHPNCAGCCPFRSSLLLGSQAWLGTFSLA